MTDNQAVVIPRTVRVRLPDGRVEEMVLDEYLKGVVPSEMGLQKPIEALKAQAVASRSYAVVARRHGHDGFDLCTTTHCQVWKPQNRYADADRAVDETSGLVIRYNRSVVSAVYFGHCDGHTRNSEDVWSSTVAYLRSVPCICGYKAMYGHGVGMCQRGAAAMAAKQKASFTDILKHYYRGVEIVQATIIPRDKLCNSMVLGRVTDGRGKARPGLKLLLTGPAGTITKGTGSDGRFWFMNLPAGRWELRVRDKPVAYPDLFTDGRNLVQVEVAVPNIPPLALSTVPMAGPRRLIGALGYDSVPITLMGPDGHEMTLLSGSIPGSEPGGFEFPLPAAGHYTLRFLDRSFRLEAGESGLRIRFNAAK